MSDAHSRCATATSASCSGVVPYWCMCRCAISAKELIGYAAPYGISRVGISEALTSLPASERCVEP